MTGKPAARRVLQKAERQDTNSNHIVSLGRDPPPSKFVVRGYSSASTGSQTSCIEYDQQSGYLLSFVIFTQSHAYNEQHVEVGMLYFETRASIRTHERTNTVSKKDNQVDRSHKRDNNNDDL